MKPITIAERLWLEPTLLGATLNYSDNVDGWHFRVGIGFRSLADCDVSIQMTDFQWCMKDRSLVIQGGESFTLTFCPGSEMERRVVLTGEALATFKNAIHFLTLTNEPRLN